MNNRAYVLIAAACGATIGAGVTYLATVKHIAAHYQLVADEEIISVKNTYARMYKGEGFETPADAIKTLSEDEQNEQAENDRLTEELGYTQPSEEDLVDAGYSRERTPAQKTSYNKISEDRVMEKLEGDQPEPVTETQPGAIEVTQIEEPEFDPSLPYTITYDEFYEDFKGHDKKTYTYYEGDRTLTDERDMPIEDIAQVIGLESLNYFGTRSKDPNIVHVRNERLETDYEVVKDERDYLEVVVGVKSIWDEDEKRKIRKMRDDD